MKITLLDDRLQFVLLATGKIHAQERKQHPSFSGNHALCGKAIWSYSTVMHHQDSLLSAKLCGRCVASLRTYARSGKVRIESEAAQ